MDLILSTSPIARHRPGENVSGMLRYNTASEQETIYDVRIDFDGSALIEPFKFNYEAHRSRVVLLKQSQMLFCGPFTMKRKALVWPFIFTIPATAVVEGSIIPLPPTMDLRFREGLRITVQYSINATIRFGSDHGCRKQEARLVIMQPATALMRLNPHSEALSFPLTEFQTSTERNRSRSSLSGIFSLPKFSSHKLRQTLRLEMMLPSTLLYDQQESLTCCLSGTTGSGNTLSDPFFLVETLELALESWSTWQNHLRIRRYIGARTVRPETEICADGRVVSLPDTIQLQDFAKKEEAKILQSYDSVVPEVSLSFTLTASVVLRHTASRRQLVLRASLPVVVHGTTDNMLLPPPYSCD